MLDAVKRKAGGKKPIPFVLGSALSKDWSARDLVCLSQVEEDQNGSEPLSEDGGEIE